MQGSSSWAALLEESRIYLDTNRCRPPETLFQPHLLGSSQAGLIEAIEFSLAPLAPSLRHALMANVHLTGGNFLFPFAEDRLFRELRKLIPVDLPVVVRRATDPRGDAWRGMAAYARSDEYLKHAVTRRQYEEEGAERFTDPRRRHFASNFA